jgi:signal peptidase II
MPESQQGGAGDDFPYSARGWLWLSALVVVLDQATKALAEWYLDPMRPIQLLPIFSLSLTYNTGAAFSFLRDAGGWQRYFFIIITLGVLVFLMRWLWRLTAGQGLLAAGLSLVIGGAGGNLIDRVATGLVVDFLDFFYAGWHFPAFNIADSAISVGAGLLILDALLSPG